MTYDEFLRHLEKAGLTISTFSELLGMNRHTLYNRRKLGWMPTHIAVIAALLGEMANKGLDYRTVLAPLHIERKPAGGIAATGVFAGHKQKGHGALIVALSDEHGDFPGASKPRQNDALLS